MSKYLAVMCGGGLGALLRFLAGGFVLRFYNGVFPLGTFLINSSGSFLIGLLMTFFIGRPDVHPNWRLFLVVGILGGYTTFSSFEWETFISAKNGIPLVALVNVVLSVVFGFVGVWLGAMLARSVWKIPV